MGERKGEQKASQKLLVKAVKSTIEVIKEESPDPMSVMTNSGRIQVRWDKNAKSTTMGQLIFFAQFLGVAGVFERWLERCPLHYSSGNASKLRDILGTWMLSILGGHSRYAHIAGLRGDAVAPSLLGMEKIISDEALRRALKVIAPAPNEAHDEAQKQAQQAQLHLAKKWTQDMLFDSVQNAFEQDWILDIDPTVKVLYGNQSGAEIGYNPKKPGRPSHTIHTYWISVLRLVIGAEIADGKSGSAAHSLPGLLAILARLLPTQRPKLIRGDCAFGNEGVMLALEEIDQPYLFKLKQTANVKRLVEKEWIEQNSWSDAGQGWEACDDRLQLNGWTKLRRVIVMRRAIKGELVVETKAKKLGRKKLQESEEVVQKSLAFLDRNGAMKIYEYVVLVSNSSYKAAAMGQLYRDRADCENGFDELKNQWGWGGFSTQDMERSNLTAQAVGLVYNWWSWYCRLAHPKGRLEAITSRPLLLAAVGKISEHAGQKNLLLTITHAAASQVKALVAHIQTGLESIRSTTPQFSPIERWKALTHYILQKIIAAAQEKANHAHAPPSQSALPA